MAILDFRNAIGIVRFARDFRKSSFGVNLSLQAFQKTYNLPALLFRQPRPRWHAILMLPFFSSHSSSPGVAARILLECRFGRFSVLMASPPWHEEQFCRKSLAPAATALGSLLLTIRTGQPLQPCCFAAEIVNPPPRSPRQGLCARLFLVPG